MNTFKTRSQIIELAEAAMARYPQYVGHWDGYVLVRIKRTVKTKLGVAFEAGELTLARPETHTSTNVRGKVGTFHTVWSQSNTCDTSVSASDVEVVA